MSVLSKYLGTQQLVPIGKNVDGSYMYSWQGLSNPLGGGQELSPPPDNIVPGGTWNYSLGSGGNPQGTYTLTSKEPLTNANTGLAAFKSSSSGSGSSGHGRGSSLGGFNIPDDAYPWSRSGLPDWGMERVKSLTAGLGGLMDSYQSSLDQLGRAPALIDQWVGQSGDTFLQGLGDFEDYVRKPFMGLAGRGVLDSTMTRDAMTDIGTGLSKNFQDFMSETTNQGLALKAANLSDQAEARGKSVALGGDLLSLANESYSEDKLAKWTALLAAVLG